MALPMPIPPWLTTRPVDFAAASEAGMNEGLAAARQWQQGMEFSAQLSQRAQEVNFAAAQRKEELERQHILEQTKLATQTALDQQQLSLNKAKIDEEVRNNRQKALVAAEQWKYRKSVADRIAAAEELRLQTENIRLANQGAKKSKDEMAEEYAQKYAQKYQKAKEDTGPNWVQKLWGSVTGFLSSPETPGQKKVKIANALREQHPDWTRDQIAKAAEQEYVGITNAPAAAPGPPAGTNAPSASNLQSNIDQVLGPQEHEED